MKCLDGKVNESRVRKLSPGRTQLVPLSSGSSSPGKLKVLKFDGQLARKFFKDKESEVLRSSICLTPSPNTKKSHSKAKDSSVLNHINSKFDLKHLKIKQEPLNTDYLVAFHEEFIVYKEYLDDLSHLVCGLNIEIHKSIKRGLGCISALFNRLIIKCAQKKTEIVLMKNENKLSKNTFCENWTQTETEIFDVDEIELNNLKSLNKTMKNIDLTRVTNRLIEVNKELIAMCGDIPKISEFPLFSGQAYYNLLKKLVSYLKVIEKCEKGIETDDLQFFQINLENLQDSNSELSEKTIEKSNVGLITPRSTNEVIEQKKIKVYYDSNQEKIYELEFELGDLKRKYSKLLNDPRIIKGTSEKIKLKKSDKETNVCNVVFTEVYLKCIEDIETMKIRNKEIYDKLQEIERSWLQLTGKDFVYGDFEMNHRLFLGLKVNPEILTEPVKNISTEKLGKPKNIKKVKRKSKKIKIILKICRIFQLDLKIYPIFSYNKHKKPAKPSSPPAIPPITQSSDSQLFTLASNEPVTDLYTESFEKLANYSNLANHPFKKNEESLFKVLDQYQWEVFQDYKSKRAKNKLKKIEKNLKTNSKSTDFNQFFIESEPLNLSFFQIFPNYSAYSKKKVLSKKNSTQITQNPTQTLPQDPNLPEPYHFKLKKITEEHLSKKCFPPCTHLNKLSSPHSSHNTPTYPISKVNII